MNDSGTESRNNVERSGERSLQDDESAAVMGTLNLVLTLAILVGVSVGGNLLYIWITTGDAEETGFTWFDQAIGFAAGGITALWSGPKGIRTSGSTILGNSDLFPWNWRIFGG